MEYKTYVEHLGMYVCIAKDVCTINQDIQDVCAMRDTSQVAHGAMIVVLLYDLLLLLRRHIGADVATQGMSLATHVTINVATRLLAA